MGLLKPRIVTHEAFDGAIRVLEAPGSADWKISEERSEGEGFTVRMLKFEKPRQLELLAKIYTLTNGAAPVAPERTDWRSVFALMFKTITNVSMLSTNEAVIDGEADAPRRIRERREVKGHQQFIITAIGVPKAFEARADDIERWFGSVTFTAA